MSDIALRVENLGKQYRIGAVQRNGGRHTYKSLRDTIANSASMPVRAVRNLTGSGRNRLNDREEIFWALRDVSFEVNKGDVVGVIGRNGAGKSTLLKILSRITEPTAGRVEVHGRVGSLLEVGTGFHPELTGRDNVYMNGAILGMKRAEIARQFDEIVAFAEVEKFIDTPVKHYSSGMYLRLAFAVAAHLDPEILVVDEVLAVGDAEFQNKCLGKMRDVSRSGRTVIFVSHDTEAVHRLTSRCLLLVGGQAKTFGPTIEVLNEYRRKQFQSSSLNLAAFRTVAKHEKVEILDIWFTDCFGQRKMSFAPLEEIQLHLIAQGKLGIPTRCEVAFAIETDTHAPILASHYSDRNDLASINNSNHFIAKIVPNILRHGRYCISTGVYSRDFNIKHDEVLHLPAFEIEGFHSEMPRDNRWGTVYLPFSWEMGDDVE